MTDRVPSLARAVAEERAAAEVRFDALEEEGIVTRLRPSVEDIMRRTRRRTTTVQERIGGRRPGDAL